jgi:uncharacterized repeat protein (TIGR01451 family)
MTNESIIPMKERTMHKGIQGLLAGCGALLVSSLAFAVADQAPAPRSAPTTGCIVVKQVAETEQEVVNEKGERVKRLVPAAKVVPGHEVVWTVTASNVCDKPAENVAINNPVPQHMSYVADTAIGPGTDITFSLDGKQYTAADALTVREADGTVRAARSDEVSHIRWVFKNALQPGAVAFARFRATVK